VVVTLVVAVVMVVEVVIVMVVIVVVVMMLVVDLWSLMDNQDYHSLYDSCQWHLLLLFEHVFIINIIFVSNKTHVVFYVFIGNKNCIQI
jgi:hypothetical protein